MKKFFYVAVLAFACVACGGNNTPAVERVATDSIDESVATAVVPQAATEVIPAAAPGPDAGGKVATEVTPAE